MNWAAYLGVEKGSVRLEHSERMGKCHEMRLARKGHSSQLHSKSKGVWILNTREVKEKLKQRLMEFYLHC